MGSAACARLNRDDDAPASAGTQSVGGDGPAKKVTLGAGYSQMDWMRLTKRDPDLAGLKGASRKRKITMEEVATHRTPEDGWTAFRGKVYNLTPLTSTFTRGRQDPQIGAGQGLHRAVRQVPQMGQRRVHAGKV